MPLAISHGRAWIVCSECRETGPSVEATEDMAETSRKAWTAAQAAGWVKTTERGSCAKTLCSRHKKK